MVRMGIAITVGPMSVSVVKDGYDQAVFSQGAPLHADDPSSVAGRLADQVRILEARTTDNGSRESVAALGVSIGGWVSRDGTSVRFGPGMVVENIDWEEVPLGTMVSNALKIPVRLENDVNCMAEYQRLRGVGQGANDFAVVYLAPDLRGLGCGLVLNDRIVRGATGGAGEFGHTVIQPGGPRCRCGNRGCLEAMLSLSNFERDLNWGRASLGRGFSGGALAAEEGVVRAQRSFQRAGRYLGQGLANLVNLVNPARIILGGPSELVRQNPVDGSSASLFMEALREALRANSFSGLSNDCEVIVTPLNLEIAAEGAALLSGAEAW